MDDRARQKSMAQVLDAAAALSMGRQDGVGVSDASNFRLWERNIIARAPF
jgi:hypothetical protein